MNPPVKVRAAAYWISFIGNIVIAAISAAAVAYGLDNARWLLALTAVWGVVNGGVNVLAGVNATSRTVEHKPEHALDD